MTETLLTRDIICLFYENLEKNTHPSNKIGCLDYTGTPQAGYGIISKPLEVTGIGSMPIG